MDRDDENPFQPNESDERPEPQVSRRIPSAKLSRWLLPQWLHDRAITVRVTTPQSVYQRGDAVPVVVRMKNSLPVPVTVQTRSPLPWNWYVDGHPEASHVPEEPPAEPGQFTFDRGERKTFRREWNGTFRVSDDRWEDAAPGEHTISAALDVERPAERSLADETTIRIE